MPERELATQVVNVTQARQEFSEILGRVFRQETRILLEKSGIPIAAIISAQDLERLTALEAQRIERFRAIDATREAFRDVADEELEAEVTKALANARREIREKRATSRPV